MSREIKFRAWDKKNKVWRAEGFHMFGEWSLLEGRGLAEQLADADVLVITQYTGLKDKNGKEIYEGDLVQFDFNNKSFQRFIVWDSYCCRFSTAQEEDEEGEYLAEGNEMEVLGNVYEHPELVK